MSDGLVTMEKPKRVTLADFLGKPVIIEPVGIITQTNSNWKTQPYQMLVWTDEGNGYEATEMLVFAKAIIEALKIAEKNGGYLAGVVAKEGSQYWIDSSNKLIMSALAESWRIISAASAEK